MFACRRTFGGQQHTSAAQGLEMDAVAQMWTCGPLSGNKTGHVYGLFG